MTKPPLSNARSTALSDGEKKPTINIDLKSRLGALNAPKTTQTMNPFGTQTLNPFGSKPNLTPESSASTSVAEENKEANPVPTVPSFAPPIAQSAPTAQTPASTFAGLGSTSSFANPLAPNPLASNPLASPLASNPLASPSNPFPSSTSTTSSFSSSSFSGLNSTTSTTPTTGSGSTIGSTGSFGSSSFGSSSFGSSSFGNNAFSSATQANVNQTTEETADQEEQSQPWGMDDIQPELNRADLLQSQSYDFSTSSDYIPKKTVKTIMIGVGLSVLIIGLLFGLTISERKNFNYRIEGWEKINAELQKPFALLKVIDENLSKTFPTKGIPWDAIKALPGSGQIAPIPTTILIQRTTLEEKGMKELSAFVIATNQLFELTLEHKAISEGLRSELEGYASGKGFEQYGQFAVHAPEFFDSCIKANKMNCSAPDPSSPPKGQIVAIAGSKLNVKEDGKFIEVVTRAKLDPKEVNASHLIMVNKVDVTGFGENVIFAYEMRKKKLFDKLNEVRRLKADLDKTLEEKIKQSKIFAF